MSTLQVSNISDGTTTVGTEYVVNGSAKAWVTFNGTGTIAIKDDFNVSSLTDNGTGQYTANLTTAVASSDFAAGGMAGNLNVLSGSNRGLRPYSRTTTSVRVLTFNATGTPTDSDDVSVIVAN